MSKPAQITRSADKKMMPFTAYTISPETIETSMLCLLSKEPEVLCETLRAFTKFCSQDMTNRELVYELGSLDLILPLVDHPELNIRRYALKALAQLCQLPQVPKQVLQDEQNLIQVSQHLMKGEDAFVLEFASLTLAELTRKHAGCEQLVAAGVLGAVFTRVKTSEDVDLSKNCLQVISNLLDDSDYSGEVSKHPNFSWPPLLALMHNPFLAIQHEALKTVDKLICRYDDQLVQDSFRNSTGILDLCDILESYKFRDVHALVLSVIAHYAAMEENASHLLHSGCVDHLLAYLEVAIPIMKPQCLVVLTKLSFTPGGRDTLFQTKTDLVFCQKLMTSNVELIADAAIGVANMSKLMPSAIRMSDTNVIEALCEILCDDSAEWFYGRVNALHALAALCVSVPKAAYNLVKPHTFSALRSITNNCKETPVEAQRLAVQCYINLLNFLCSMKAMLNADFIGEVLNTLQRWDMGLKILVCSLLKGLVSDEVGRKLFSINRGEEIVSKNLEIEHIGLRTALCDLLAATVTDETAETYLELGTIHYMVENKLTRYVVSTWESALEALFDHHPSAKFAYKGRLEINDFTKEGFYVMKRLESPLPGMRALLQARGPYHHAVLVAAFLPRPGTDSEVDANVTNDPITQNIPKAVSVRRSPAPVKPVLPDDPSLREHLFKLKLWFGDARLHEYLKNVSTFKKSHPWSLAISRFPFDEEFTQDASSLFTLEPLEDDSRLTLMLKRDTAEASTASPALSRYRFSRVSPRSSQFTRSEDVEHDIIRRDKCEEVSSMVKQQAQLLAEFVNQQMSGLSEEGQCALPSVDLHLADLMVSHDSRVVSLGAVRAGGALERAVLFKVLADRLAIPCALVRGAAGHACCHVAIPEITEDIDEYGVTPDTRYPASLLRANYAVELMSACPTLRPLQGPAAARSCGRGPNYTVAAKPVTCECVQDDQYGAV